MTRRTLRSSIACSSGILQSSPFAAPPMRAAVACVEKPRNSSISSLVKGWSIALCNIDAQTSPYLYLLTAVSVS